MAAINFTTIKNTNQETIIKFQGGATDTGTITINTLAAGSQALTSGGTPTVNIVKFAASGLLTSNVTVTRNSVAVINAAAEHCPMLDYTAFAGISDGVNNTYDLAFTIAGAAATGYIVLRKITGWTTKVEYATYGAYEDVSRVGASTTLVGSPDKA
jgi:hypothetical protein